jgi:hypothetical protein
MGYNILQKMHRVQGCTNTKRYLKSISIHNNTKKSILLLIREQGESYLQSG